MGWQDAPVVGANAQPAWASAPTVQPAQPAQPRRASPPPLVGRAQHVTDTMSLLKDHPFTTGAGLLENMASGISAGAGSLADTVTGSDPGTHDWAYRPRTEAGQKIAELSAQEGAQIGHAYDRVLGTGPAASTVKERIPQVLGSVGTVLGAKGVASGIADVAPGVGRMLRPKPGPAAEQIVSRLNAQQSTSAAAAAPSLTNVSQDLRGAIQQTAKKNGGAINPEVLERHVEADTLPVPVRLTEGQATQDPMIISQERNTRGQSQVMVDHLNDQNRHLAQNVQAIRDEVGPEVFSTNATEHADTVIGAYRAKDAIAQKQVTADYKALKDANGGQFPVDASALQQNAAAALHQQLLFDHAPKAIMATLQRLADKGGMTFENFESMRTNLARIQRSVTADGNEKAAAGAIRQAMEDLPLQPEAAAMKPLADRARASAKAQFDALDADPAYKAAVEGSVPADRFISRYVINGTRDDLARMRENLASDDRALQTIGVATVDHLRDAARLSPHYEGTFAAATYNRNLQALSPKLQSLVSPKTAEQLQQLGNVARNVTAQPTGSFVNNSNTAVAAAADYGTRAAEQVVNAKAGGLPVGTIGRRLIEGATKNRNARRSIAPGAGLGRLGEIGRRQ